MQTFGTLPRNRGNRGFNPAGHPHYGVRVGSRPTVFCPNDRPASEATFHTLAEANPGERVVLERFVSFAVYTPVLVREKDGTMVDPAHKTEKKIAIAPPPKPGFFARLLGWLPV